MDSLKAYRRHLISNRRCRLYAKMASNQLDHLPYLTPDKKLIHKGLNESFGDISSNEVIKHIVKGVLHRHQDRVMHDWFKYLDYLKGTDSKDFITCSGFYKDLLKQFIKLHKTSTKETSGKKEDVTTAQNDKQIEDSNLNMGKGTEAGNLNANNIGNTENNTESENIDPKIEVDDPHNVFENNDGMIEG